jgi:hypothetical protein
MMAKGGAPCVRLLPFSVCAALAWGAPAWAQDLAPAPAAPMAAPEELAHDAPHGSGPSATPSGPTHPTRAEALEPSLPAPVSMAEPTAVSGEVEVDNPTALKYLLQRVEVVGNRGTRTSLIKSFVPIETGASFDVADPELEALRYRLLGTGWYDRVELRLARGSQPGWVVLVIEVEERSTLVFQQLAAGVGWTVEGANGKEGGDRPPARAPKPYLGLAVAETNLLGTGRTLAVELLGSPDQQGGSLTFFAPAVRFSRWSLRARGTLVKGREYFGGDRPVVSADCPTDEDTKLPKTNCEVSTSAAVLDYWRSSLSLGTARDVGAFTRLSLEWHGDFVKVPQGGMPLAAGARRGLGILAEGPIDFSIEPKSSYVSMLTLGLLYDKRDSAILPSRGALAAFNGDLASGLIASDYQFVRMQASYNHWFPLSWGHTVRFGLFAGALFGYAPFFYKFFVSDLTDLQPTRILGLNLDHRPAPNLFGLLSCGKAFDSSCGTAIAQMRQEELAGRIDAEYVWPLVRGRRKFVKSADAYFLVGLYALAASNDLRLGVPGYSGIARLPVDLTLDAGVRLDTQLGVFQIGLAKLAWLPVR